MAIKSLFVFDFCLAGSRISIALTVNKDSKVPTKANMITYFIKIPVWLSPEKSAFTCKLSIKLPI